MTPAEQDVVDYLRMHPNFFERHPGTLLELDLYHRPGRAAVSLVQRQVELLRKRNRKLESQLRDLVDVARDNHELVENIHELAIALLASAASEQRLRIIETSLKEDFSVECAALILFADPQAVRVGGGFLKGDGFLKVVDRRDPGLNSFAGFLKSGQPRCGPLRSRQKSFAFGARDVELHSAALIPIGERAELGFIVIGSRDPDHFNPGKRMDYLSRLGEVVAMALFVSGDSPGAESGPKASGT